MILKEIYLYPDLGEFSDEIIHPFRDQSRSICNFLERHLSAEKFETPNFKKICFVGTRQAVDEPYVNSSGALIVNVSLDTEQYKKCTSVNELNEFFIQRLLEGLEKCRPHMALPLDLLKNAMDEFRRNHYKNEWTFKQKKIKGTDYVCALECQLTIDCFLMNLKVLRKDTPVLDKEILRTAPDEIAFGPYLKDLKEEGGRIKVIDKSGVAFYTTTVSSLDKL
ncbi:hypothetical protein ACNT2N_04170 [Pseudomonas thivervalensis]|uniref:Uncharacterized protein n=1 Tax=Pseudomonas thivervalensis TaxID=86265 RepID=A0A2Z4ZJD7_9PSED|nr:hypothetical protein [Pseudomonas thivervalensis]AXA58032.1 hypothetical protein CE140_27950 [Pseudomonas thivervalensis]AXA63744.1 hypothetical protein CEQ51_27945 [Pseudomonas thivervalensis]